MDYALVVEWKDTDTFSTFFFDKFETAKRERDKERNDGNFANIYMKCEE